MGIYSNWCLSQNSPKVVIESSIEAADYDANKFRKLKVVEHNDWYNALIAATKTLLPYTAEHFPMGLNFNFNGTGNWNDLLNGGGSPVKVSAPQATVVTQAPSAVKKE